MQQLNMQMINKINMIPNLQQQNFDQIYGMAPGTSFLSSSSTANLPHAQPNKA